MKTRVSAPSLLFMVMLTTPAVAFAATRNVPAQYVSISAALSAAASGDTILLAPGTYSGASNCSLTIGKAVTIASSAGPATTIWDCGSLSLGYANVAGITFKGLTVQNGSTSSLGVLVFQASGTIDTCVFRNNSGSSGDGLVVVPSGTLTISNSSFEKNSGARVLWLVGGSAVISHSAFTDNTGGAIDANTTSLVVTDTTFARNSVNNNHGAALYLRNGQFTFSHCTFSENAATATGAGGGVVFCSAQGIDTPCSFDHCLFNKNTANGLGGVALGATSNQKTSFTFTDCLFTGNVAKGDGAVLSLMQTSAKLFNNSFFANATTTGSGVISGDATSSVSITNTILWGDAAPKEISQTNVPGTVSVKSSNIAQAGYAGSNGNLNAAPGYFNADAGDLRIDSTSVCANTGTVVGALTTDYLDSPWDGGVSIGAYAAIPVPKSFSLTAPTLVVKGAPVSLTVTAKNGAGQVLANYQGVVHVSSGDGAATLPADFALSAGVGSFAVTLATLGAQTVTVTDAQFASVSASAQLTVVACAADTDCGGGLHCEPATHVCVSCVSNTDCAAPTPACNLATHVCVGCLSNTDCSGATPACDLASKVCVGCLSNTDCSGATPACDLASKVCVGCLSNADCSGSTPECDLGSHVCVACLSNTDCSGVTPSCDLATHACAPCQASSTDGGASVCVSPTPVCLPSGACAVCGADLDCAAPLHCEPTTNVCVGCLRNADCSATSPVCEGATHVCLSCQAAADAGLVACADPSTPVCFSSGACVQCSATNLSACPAAGECQVSSCAATGRCVMSAAADGTACASGSCTSGVCQAPTVAAPKQCGCGSVDAFGFVALLALAALRRRSLQT